MGILIKVNDVTFTNTVGYANFPIIPQLKNLYFFGGTEAKSLIDKSGNGNDGAVTGTITVSDNYITFSTAANSNYIQSPDGVTSGTSKIAGVALVKKNGNRGVITMADTSSGFIFGTERIAYTDSDGWKSHVFTLADAEGFYPMAWICDGTGIYAYRLSSKGTLTQIDKISGGDFTTASVQKVTFGGSVNNWAMTGSADIAVVAYYEGEVSRDNLLNALEYCKAYGESKGLVIV